MAFPALFVPVHEIDEFFYRMRTVAHDHGGQTFGDGADRIVDHQNPKIPAGNVFFHDNAVAEFAGFLKRLFDFLLRIQVEEYALALIAVERLQNNGKSDLLRRYRG
ncbi:hypothetical protein SDC9_166299 [bioreactor metagenome]|uniref:Uncharacterized protein n=1 Tax=bioreactor metagenome TaxID=1076179 RepID=A0A645G473_9ZZZZ